MEEITPGDARQVPEFDTFAWPLCAGLGEAGIGWVMPRIPEAVLFAVFTSYLDLAADETLLAIVGGTEQEAAASCALTTKRIYWPGELRRRGEERPDPERPPATSGGPPPRRCEYVAYKDLPETIEVTGAIAKVVNLGAGREIGLGTQARPFRALAGFLAEVRARVAGERPLPEFEPAELTRMRRDWPEVRAADLVARAIEAEVRGFQTRALATTRAVVTPVLAAACALVYVLMVVRGVSPIQPANEAMVEWGASFGPLVVFDGQVWRLLSSMFLHFGAVHLAMNLWCLLTTGPVVERFFGHVGYAALYVLSGFGGAIASLFFHPTFICAGASGAIFGIIGGLLGFLAVRHRDVPAAILRPMRSGTLAFLGYNVIFGLSSPKIDMAGHLGGLATGFFAGLLLAGVGRGLLRRAVAIAALSVGLGVLAHQVIGLSRGRILADPKIGPALENQLHAAPAWNTFNEAMTPLLGQFEHNERAIQVLLTDIDRGLPARQTEATLDHLTADSETLGRGVAALPAGNDEIRAMAGKLVQAQKHQARVLAVLRRFLPDRDAAVLEGPKGLRASIDAYGNDFKEMAALRDAYFQSHGLVRKPP